MELYLDLSQRAPAGAGPEEQAEQLLGCYQTFLGHELPGLLVSLQAFARLLLLQADSVPPEVRALLERMAGLTRRADELVRRVAELGRLRREPPLGPPLCPAEVVQESAAEVRCTGTPFSCRSAPETPRLCVSRRLLHQTLVQLFRNSAQATLTDRPTHVEVQVDSHPLDFPGWAVALRVRDDGRGLTDEQAPRLFVPFTPGRNANAERPGLGLFLVLQVLACWHGAVHVESTPGEGACFTLLLPSDCLFVP